MKFQKNVIRSNILKKGIFFISALCVLTLLLSSTITAFAMGKKEVKGYAKVSSSLNIREAPSFKSDVIGIMPSGAIVTVVSSEDEEWTKIMTDNGKVGYVSNDYFKIAEVDSEEFSLEAVAVITAGSSSKDRNFNMAKACKAIDGLILEPDEEFAWYDTEETEGIVGPASEENGYKKAPIIVNEEPAMGYGGGVCQVSTALYNAINKMGIEPTEHHHRSIPSSYVEKGMDATVSYPIKNFVFTNTKDYDIYIKAYAEGPQVVVEIYKALY